MPQRIQMKRTRGWRKPAGAVKVARWRKKNPGKWGNPFEVERPGDAESHREAVAQFRRWLEDHPERVAEARQMLRGRDLMCWCRPDLPCHADVWLEVANANEGDDK